MKKQKLLRAANRQKRTDGMFVRITEREEQKEM